MNKKVTWLIVAAVIVIAVIAYYNSGPIVSVQGYSSLDVEPDLVSVNLNIETRADTAQEAQSENKLIADDLINGLVSLGFPRGELKLVNYNVYPEYDWNSASQRITGYVVSQQLIVKTENTDEVPAIVDSAINSGALVFYINFEISDDRQKTYKAKALEEASSDAREKAAAIALGQGRRLGRLVSIESQEFNYGPVIYYDKGVAEASGGSLDESAREAASSITPQDIKVDAQVSVKYRLRAF